MIRAAVPITLLVLLSRPLLAQCPDGTPPPCRSARPAPAPAASPNSVAVLYFDNGSRDTADAYLADGITEELIVRLGQAESLQVKARGTVVRFKGSSADPSSIGRQLNVAYVVTGSVRKNGPRISVVAELARTSGGVRIWGDVFDRTSSDVMGIEADIARAVATAIAGRLRPAEQARLTRRATTNPAAYEAYLRGNAYLVRRGNDVARAIHRYEDAVRLDPAFAAAWARLAVAYTLTSSWGYDSAQVSSDSLRARAARAASRALALDSGNSDAWLANGSVTAARFGLLMGRFALLRAIALDSTNAEAWHTVGVHMQRDGDANGAEFYLRRAIALEEDRAISYYWLAQVLYQQRRFAAAAAFADTLARHPLYRGDVDVALPWRAEARALGGDRRALDDLAALATRPVVGGLGGEAFAARVIARLGDTATARERLARAIPTGWDPLPNDGEASAVILALMATGQHERAITILEQRAPTNLNSTYLVLRDPLIDPIRADPRIQRLIELVRPN